MRNGNTCTGLADIARAEAVDAVTRIVLAPPEHASAVEVQSRVDGTIGDALAVVTQLVVNHIVASRAVEVGLLGLASRRERESADTRVAVGVIEGGAIGATLERIVEGRTAHIGDHHIGNRTIGAHDGNLAVSQVSGLVVDVIVLLAAVQNIDVVLLNRGAVGHRLLGGKNKRGRHITRTYTHIKGQILSAWGKL